MDSIRELLAREFFKRPAMRETLANTLACDYLRKINVDERPKVLALIESQRPDVAAIIHDRYPHHCV